MCAAVAKIYSKNEFSHSKIVKNEKEICASFVITPQTACMNNQKHSKVLYYLRFQTQGSLNKSLVGVGVGVVL